MKTNRSLMTVVLVLSLLFGVRGVIACAQSLTLISVTPSAFQSGSFSIAVTGTGFTPTCVVNFNESFSYPYPVSSTTTYVSPTQLTVNGSVYSTYGNTYYVTVFNTTTNRTSNALTISVSPLLYNLYLFPDNVPAGSGPITLNVGSYHRAGYNISWTFNGITTTLQGWPTFPSTQFVSIPASLLTTPGIAYVQQQGSITAPFYITGNAKITSISPNTASAGDPGFTLTMNGAGFVSGDTVKWDDSSLQTTFVSTTQLQALVPASLVSKTGYAQVTAGYSYPAMFIIDTVHVSGKVNLQEETQPAQTVTLEFRPVGSGAARTFTTLLTSDGSFDARGIAPGSYNLAAKGYKWLRSVVPLTAGQTPVSNVQIALFGGDANADNTVDIGDFGVVVNAYNGSASTAGSGYDIRADFNDDGVIDIADFGLLVNNYGSHGAN